MKMVPAVPRLHKFYNTVHVQCSNISLIIYLLHISKCFPQLFTACLKPKYLTNLPLSPPSLQTLNIHTLVTVGLLTRDALLALFFHPFCLQKEKLFFFFSIRSFKPINHNREAFKGIPQIFFFCCMVLLQKVTKKITFISVSLLWNAKTQGKFSTKKNPMVKEI